MMLDVDEYESLNVYGFPVTRDNEKMKNGLPRISNRLTPQNDTPTPTLS